MLASPVQGSNRSRPYSQPAERGRELCMSHSLTEFTPDIDAYIAFLETLPWFLSLGKANKRDAEVTRIQGWEEWPGPMGPYGDWFGRWQSVVKERLEAKHSDQNTVLGAVWQHIERLVLNRASANVPLFDPNEDAWFGPTACVWGASYTACLVSWHVELKAVLPPRLRAEWTWYQDGHWPCGYAEEPPGYLDETSVGHPAGRLLVY